MDGGVNPGTDVYLAREIEGAIADDERTAELGVIVEVRAGPAEAADAVGVDLYVYGHAHDGTEQGMTAGGISVRNVAQPVRRRPYALYRVGEG